MKMQSALGFGIGMLFCAILSVALPHQTLANLHSPSSLSVPEAVRWAIGEEKPVLVIDVREPSRAAAVRAAVSSDRVVAESKHGFALRERRLVVSSLEETGEILGSVGWEDAHLRILRFEPVRDREDRGEGRRTDAQRLAELMDADPSRSAEELNAQLCDVLRRGDLDLHTPGLLEHLKTTTIAQLSVDQPGYSGMPSD